MIGHLGIKLRQLVHDHRCERVLDASMEHFVSGGDDSNLFVLERFQFQDWLSTSQFHGLCLDLFHFFFFNDQRDNAGTCQLVPLLHGKIAMAGGNHHLAKGVDLF